MPLTESSFSSVACNDEKHNCNDEVLISCRTDFFLNLTLENLGGHHIQGHISFGKTQYLHSVHTSNIN
jgi:hypothetical protein